MSVYFLILACILQSIAVSPDNLKLTVFYNVASSESSDFIRDQLLSTYEKIDHKFLFVEFVPLGNFQVDNSTKNASIIHENNEYEFKSLKLQICATEIYGTEAAILFINCLMELYGLVDDEIVDMCVQSSYLDPLTMKNCIESQDVNDIIIINSEKALSAQLDRIPGIAFDDIYVKSISEDAEKDLFTLVCSLINFAPSSCKNIYPLA